MLLTLKIEDIAVIEETSIEFARGLNVMTGETGSGKSIIIDAINAVIGERTSRELVRAGADDGRVTALFIDITAHIKLMLKEFEIPCEEDNSLLIQRKITADGKTVCRINGQPVTVSILKRIGSELISIHGQNDSQALLSPEKHYIYIDKLAENDVLLTSYKSKYNELCDIRSEIAFLSSDDAEKARRIEMLTFQIDELTSAYIKIGERDELNKKRNAFSDSEKITQGLSTACAIIDGDGELSGAQKMLFDAAQSLTAAAGYYSEIAACAEEIGDMAYRLGDFSGDFKSTLANIEYNPQELDLIEERLDLLYKLSRKYGESEEDMLKFLEDIEKELKQTEFSEKYLEELSIKEMQLLKDAEDLAAGLSERRKKAAEIFAENVMDELCFLEMPRVQFGVQIEEKALSENGRDTVEFMISANPGEPPKPIAKIASGGELSRIMLAIKNVLSDKDEIGTLIFDEIDTGVSGRAAQKIALKLKSAASAERQVICVTHLAQIAAQADNHLMIEKSFSENRAFTKVYPLDFEGRKNELARILGGLEITKLQLESAEEMLIGGKLNERI